MLQELGRGREATVFAVLRKKTAGEGRPKTPRVLALRVPHKQGPVSKYTRRVCAMPVHQNVARIHAHDLVSGIVLLEFVGGGTLSDEIICDAISPRRALEVAKHVLRGVAHLHEHGFVHGDICPANILVDDNRGCKLTDFFNPPGKNLHVTPAFSSPESARGNIVTASDIWSIGCVMLALGGRAPWGAGEALLEDGTIVDLSHPAALLYHLAARSIAKKGPPEYSDVVACEGLFSSTLALVFVVVEERASVVKLLEKVCVFAI
jgi:serine/threonine protein kinase